MNFLIYLSNYMIPLVMLYIIITGMVHGVRLFDEFTEGAKDGLKVVVQILPTLVGLMVAIGLLRSSGVLEMLTGIFEPVTNLLKFPAELVPLALIKMFSSSAATSLLLDIFDKWGPDSFLGYTASLMMASSETIFYTLSVYFLATGTDGHPPVTRMRWTLAGSLVATFVGIIASVLLAR